MGNDFEIEIAVRRISGQNACISVLITDTHDFAVFEHIRTFRKAAVFCHFQKGTFRRPPALFYARKNAAGSSAAGVPSAPGSARPAVLRIFHPVGVLLLPDITGPSVRIENFIVESFISLELISLLLFLQISLLFISPADQQPDYPDDNDCDQDG